MTSQGLTLLRPSSTPGSDVYRRVRWLATCCLALLLVSACAASPSRPKPQPSRIAAATYFGHAWPVNFWTSDLTSAPQDFRQISRDGFNAIVLVVPWGYFQPTVSPPTYNWSAFARLKQLIRQAQQADLGVLVRVSYMWDDPAHDQYPGMIRFERLLSDPHVYSAWLSYMATVDKICRQYSNFWGGYISWEDFDTLFLEASSAKSAQQRQALATQSGYDTWLKPRYSLIQLDGIYHQKFTSTTDVPTPLRSTPAFRLLLTYWDYELVNRIFEPALRRFPGLTMEARVDEDPIYQGTSIVTEYSHAATYRLPGTHITGIYFNPYMGISPGVTETVGEAVDALHTVLQRVSSEDGNRSIRIYELQLYDNTPANASNAHLPLSAVPQFIRAATATLTAGVMGYSVWTYRDYHANALFNPSFAVGTSGWIVGGRVLPVTDFHGHDAAVMAAGSSLRQDVSFYGLPYRSSTTRSVTVSFNAQARQSNSMLTVSVGAACKRVFRLGRAETVVTLQCPVTGLRNFNVNVAASGSLIVSNFQEYCYTQVDDLYSANGTAEPGLAALRRMNLIFRKGGR